MGLPQRLPPDHIPRYIVRYNAPAPKLRVAYQRLAAKNGLEEVFKTLVDMGALNSLDMDESRRLVQILCLPSTKNKFVSYMYPHEFDDTIRRLDQGPNVAQPLVPLIRARAPPDLIRLVVSRGADLDMTWPYRHRELIRPLSAAILANSESLFLLLLQLGAKIDGAKKANARFMSRHGLHIPVFAAARTMATASHGRAMMELCLGQGSEINYRIPSFDVHLGRLINPARCYLVTPLLVYVQSIKSWKSQAGAPSPAEELAWLLEKGALLSSKHKSGLEWLRGACDSTPTCIEWLLAKWGVAALRHPNFVAVIKFLLQRGEGRGHIHWTFLKHFVHELGHYAHARWRASVHDELKALTVTTLSYLSEDEITITLEKVIRNMRSISSSSG
ncbi:hypothetical protein B0T22DRAFT_34781 [Podospora appendiculata]|uniref:Ankyrin repeat protein n=1 Tax=Podospora appendiculata TaxID=314037 RepID=A0AAE0XGT5_9PEZI|nr:hypothetical protein B0T22DRAFT_34781 [Podospora appendiculata]